MIALLHWAMPWKPSRGRSMAFVQGMFGGLYIFILIYVPAFLVALYG